MINIKLYKDFGEFCSDGNIATNYLNRNILPMIHKNKKLTIDFTNIRNMNSSFANALFANLIVLEGVEVLNNIKFTNYNDNIKVMISSALNLGKKKLSESLIEPNS